jgi:hypothetical protein
MVTEEEVRELHEWMLDNADGHSFREIGRPAMRRVAAICDEVLAQRDVPAHLAERSAVWLVSNKKQPDEVRWGVFPLGMVERWIERAEGAEGLAVAQRDVVAAATDPSLVILEYHSNAGEVANAEMKRAADRFRAAVAAVVSGTPEAKE